jgi:two-component system OmpR family sensor kinase
MFYFKNEKALYFDLTKSKMQNIVSKISSELIMTHMSGERFNQNMLFQNSEYKLALYDKNKKRIVGNVKEKIDFSKKFIQHENHFILVDDSALGHMGVYYIVLEDDLFFQKVKTLKKDILLAFVGIYFFVALVGMYLARMFLQPIRQEREKLNRFIKDTTHELNTPVSAILMSTQNENLSEKQIERVKLSAQRIAQMYKDLTYVFLESKELYKEQQTYVLKHIIEEELTYFKPLYNKKNITVTTQLDESSCYMNKDDLIRIFNNILSNAIKYNTINGTIDIILKENRLSIQDTGIGIDSQALADIFKRYHRANHEQGGFGIGLNIVHEICKKYNIQLHVESTLHQGTTFYLDFPSASH